MLLEGKKVISICNLLYKCRYSDKEAQSSFISVDALISSCYLCNKVDLQPNTTCVSSLLPRVSKPWHFSSSVLPFFKVISIVKYAEKTSCSYQTASCFQQWLFNCLKSNRPSFTITFFFFFLKSLFSSFGRAACSRVRSSAAISEESDPPRQQPGDPGPLSAANSRAGNCFVQQDNPGSGYLVENLE